MKVFFFGGTFDPPHLGHEKIIDFCLDLCDKLILIPNRESPEKRYTTMTSSIHRLNMLNLLYDNEKVLLDEYELNSKETNYTYLTIQYLKEQYKSNLTMIVGYDQLINLKNWYNYKNIIDEVDILCFNREKAFTANKKIFSEIKNLKTIESFDIDVSSSSIRRKLFSSNEINYSKILNPKVLQYINKNKLYES